MHEHDHDDDVITTLVAAGMDALSPTRPGSRRSDVETVVRAIAPLIQSDALGRPTRAQLEWHVEHLASLQQQFAEVREEADKGLGEREAMLSTLASLVAFAYLVDVEFEPDWMDAARDILSKVGWEVDPQDWRNWDWSDEERP